MTPKELRYALAADIESAFSLSVFSDPLGLPWTFYAAPPETPTVPCVVIAPRTPYRVDSTFCDEEVNLGATVILQRAASTDGLDLMDDTCTIVRDAINKGSTGCRVTSINDVGPTIELGGVDYLTATLNITGQSG